MKSRKRPEWLKVKYKPGYDFTEVENLLESLNLNTVCEEAGLSEQGRMFQQENCDIHDTRQGMYTLLHFL